jgi:hypothetical protein
VHTPIVTIDGDPVQTILFSMRGGATGSPRDLLSVKVDACHALIQTVG